VNYAFKTCGISFFLTLFRHKTRGKLWRRPKPTPPSLWPAWPIRSMP